MTARFTFLGHPMTDEHIAKWPSRIPIRDERDGTYVERVRPEQVPLKCKCSHLEAKHGQDRRGRLVCFGSSVCGCIAFRPQETSA